MASVIAPGSRMSGAIHCPNTCSLVTPPRAQKAQVLAMSAAAAARTSPMILTHLPPPVPHRPRRVLSPVPAGPNHAELPPRPPPAEAPALGERERRKAGGSRQRRILIRG